MQSIHFRSSSYHDTIITRKTALIVLATLSTLITLADAFQAFAPKLTRHPSSFRHVTYLLATDTDADAETDADADASDLLSTLQEKFAYDGRILTPDTAYRCGFVSLIGAANMGKSTLLNALLEEDLCTATHRPQTTRHSILGVLTNEEQQCQICFMDTPGVIEDPAYKLQEGMMEAVQGAFRDADVILVITDLFSTPIPDDTLFQKLNLSDKKKIVVINKIDLADMVNVDGDKQAKFHGANAEEQAEQRYRRTMTVEDAVQNWRGLVPDALAIIPLCASIGPKDKGVVALRTLLFGGPDVGAAFRGLGRPLPGMFQPGVTLIGNAEASDIIPSSPPLYDADTLTDRTERYVYC